MVEWVAPLSCGLVMHYRVLTNMSSRVRRLNLIRRVARIKRWRYHLSDQLSMSIQIPEGPVRMLSGLVVLIDLIVLVGELDDKGKVVLSRPNRGILKNNLSSNIGESAIFRLRYLYRIL